MTLQRTFWLLLCASLGLTAVDALAATQRAAEARQGITFYVLRVIYSENDRQGTSIIAYNKTSRAYLMQSRIRPLHHATGGVDWITAGVAAVPLIVTPPLSRLEANGELTLRIRRNGQRLPSDRESVFFISMQAIPAQSPPDQQSTASRMILTITNNIKVFYRPAALSRRAVADMAPKLRFRRDGAGLTADNPTPYWLTFSRLSVGSYTLGNDQLRLMVPPFGQQCYPLPTGAVGNVRWQLIDEDGWDTQAEERPL